LSSKYKFRPLVLPRRGNCYVTCEALYHLLGGKEAGWKPMNIQHEGASHWFLRHDLGYKKETGMPHIVIDPTMFQFKTKPDYSKARGRGFLTKKPSKKALVLMGLMLWRN